MIDAHERRVTALLARAVEDGIAEGAFRKVDADAVAHLMYQLGRSLVGREVTGRSEFALDRILGVMNDVLGRGLLAPSRAAPTPGRRRRRS